MIYITGDIHGDTSRIANMIERHRITTDDTIVILGDVGMNYYGNKHGDRRRKKKLDSYGIKKYHLFDVLLIDRLQYIAGKEATQEELFNILEKRQSDHKQTVFAGSVHPSQIPILNPELSDCLTSGLCVEIPNPDFKGKAEIIFRKLNDHGIDWPMEACKYVALNISSGVNQIEGEIYKILAFGELL